MKTNTAALLPFTIYPVTATPINPPAPAATIIQASFITNQPPSYNRLGIDLKVVSQANDWDITWFDHYE